jgi:hypothetical protein
MQEGLLSGALALPCIQLLSKLSSDDATAVAQFVGELKLSLHKQRELIDIIIEIAKLEDCSIPSVIGAPEISSILSVQEADLPRKSGLVRKHLKNRRYPNLSRAQDEFDQLKTSLKLGQHVSLKAPPGFESKRYGLSLSFETTNELETQIAALRDLLSNVQFRRHLSSRSSL